MKKILLHTYICILLSTLTGCYGYRQVGLLQERDDLPHYDSVAYEPYRLQVNDEIIYRVITMDETIAKTLSANNSASGQKRKIRKDDRSRSKGLHSPDRK